MFNFQAGHCVYGDVKHFEVYLGVVDFEGQVAWATKVEPQDTYLHKEYDDSRLKNDIALIKLNTAPDNLFDDPFIASIALPSEYFDLTDYTGTIVRIHETTNYVISILNKDLILDWIWTRIRQLSKWFISFKIQHLKSNEY